MHMQQTLNTIYVYIYIYICLHVCVYICICICIYIYIIIIIPGVGGLLTRRRRPPDKEALAWSAGHKGGATKQQATKEWRTASHDGGMHGNKKKTKKNFMSICARVNGSPLVLKWVFTRTSNRIVVICWGQYFLIFWENFLIYKEVYFLIYKELPYI